MNFIDLITCKKQGIEHSYEEIKFIIDSYMSGVLSESQLAAWLTAISFSGMTKQETAYLTEILGNSGKIINFEDLNGRIADKHSTGGVGDKVTITLIPLLAAAGIPVAKLADKGHGSSAGTIDKLEAIPNFNTNLSIQAIVNQVKDINAVISSQDDDLAPAEKKIYALRNKIGAVNSDALIASSIISKKIASGASNIIIDVKYGSGALKKTPEEAVSLSNLIIDIGKIIGKHVTVAITTMEEPLGRAIGNSLEIIEAIEFLKGNIDSGDLAGVTYSIASMVLLQLDLYENISDATDYLKSLVNSGKALDKFREIIIAQGGNPEIIENYDKFALPRYKVECESKKNGYIKNINAFNISCAAKVLGAEKDSYNQPIDHSVGIYLNKKSGDYVNKGETLYTIYSNSEEDTVAAQRFCDEAFSIHESKPSRNSLIYKIISTKDEDDNV